VTTLAIIRRCLIALILRMPLNINDAFTMIDPGFFARFLILVALVACSEGSSAEQSRQQQATAMAMWKERCKTAGEKIHKTVDNVEGIYLMKIRTTTNFDAQFEMDDPYGHDSTNNEYILNFLRGFYHQRNEKPVPGSPPRTGYQYVEAQDPQDGKRYRYAGSMKVVGRMDETAPGVKFDLKRNPNFDLNIYKFVLEKVPALGEVPRYGVTYEDISTREERKYWIAGSSLKVIDLKTNEVIAERIGYMVDWAQGSRAGGRSPWLFAADNACPNFNRNNPIPVPGPGFSAQAGQTIDFVEKALKPSK
jgi:hypothetical protein